MAVRMVNSTINSFWRGGPPNRVSFARLKSFVTHGRRARIFTYESIPNAPKGVEIADVRLVLHEDDTFLFEGLSAPLQRGSIAPQEVLWGRVTDQTYGIHLWYSQLKNIAENGLPSGGFLSRVRKEFNA
jgi:hypothetical protein